MDIILVMVLFLAGVLSSFQRDVDDAAALHHHPDEQQNHQTTTKRRTIATRATLDSIQAWSSYQSSSSCHICRDCMNTSYSYLCGRLQCQCLDSLEYCILVVEKIQADAITFVQLNASDRSSLGPTTLTGKACMYVYI